MMNRTVKLALTASALLLALFVGQPNTATAAGSRSSAVAVTASVAASCAISAGSIAFGPYDPMFTNAAADLDQTGTFTITCTKGSPVVSVDLGVGSNAGVGTQRQMISAGVPLQYDIYKDAGRTNKWGTTAGGTLLTNTDLTSPASLNGTGAAVTVTMYGRIPQNQVQAVAGSYTDSVVSTVNF